MAAVPYVLLVVTVPQTRMTVVPILVRMVETALTELIVTLVPASQVTLGTTAKRVRLDLQSKPVSKPCAEQKYITM